MIKSVLKIGGVLVVGILIYNFFFGSPEEKAQSKAIFGQFKQVGRSVGDLLKNEKAKMDAGKYDTAIDKITGLLDGLKSQSKEMGDKYTDRIKELEDKKNQLDQLSDNIKQLQGDKSTQTEANGKGEQFINQFEDFYKDMEGLVDDMEKESTYNGQ